MTTAELNYTFINPYPDMLVRGRNQTVEMRVEYAGAVVVVTASGSTFRLVKPDGTDLVAASAVTVSGAGVPSFDLTAATHLPDTLTPLGEGYQEVWTLVLADGTTRTVDREAALCLRPLVPVVSHATLLEDYPTLDTFLGSSLTSTQTFITSAWTEILNRLIGEGVLSYLVKSGAAFRKAHKELSYAKLFQWLAMHQGSRGNWLELAQKHSIAYEAAWKGINFRTDDNHDGQVDDDTRRRATQSTVLHVNSPPTRRFVRDSRW